VLAGPDAGVHGRHAVGASVRQDCRGHPPDLRRRIRFVVNTLCTAITRGTTRTSR
jgi:hypothetical protein